MAMGLLGQELSPPCASISPSSTLGGLATRSPQTSFGTCHCTSKLALPMATRRWGEEGGCHCSPLGLSGWGLCWLGVHIQAQERLKMPGMRMVSAPG